MNEKAQEAGEETRVHEQQPGYAPVGYNTASTTIVAPVPNPMPGVQWMVRPQAIPGVPPGLEYLNGVDQLLMHQQVELFEAVTGIQTKNRYAIKNSLGQQCYFAYEESELCMRICCKNLRAFEMHIVDNLGQEVIHAYRSFKCCVGCCWCVRGEVCAFLLYVESPVGTPIGRIIQLCSGWKPKYAIQNENDETLLIINGPCCVWSGACCTCDVAMEVYTADESTCIGAISRQYSGVAKELFTNATNFGLTFPVDLDVKVKALLLAATFLIDVMYFERNDQ